MADFEEFVYDKYVVRTITLQLTISQKTIRFFQIHTNRFDGLYMYAVDVMIQKHEDSYASNHKLTGNLEFGSESSFLLNLETYL